MADLWFRDVSNFALMPDDHQAVYYKPLQDASVALQPEVSTPLYTDAKTVRIPTLEAEPEGTWTAEGSPIPTSTPTTSEVSVTPPKVAYLLPITRELLGDTGGEALFLAQTSMVRSLAKMVDRALFAPTADGAEAPKGLRDLTDYQSVYVSDGFTDIDPFVTARALASSVGEQITAFVMNPMTALTLSTIKESAMSNRPLLQPDVTVPGRKLIDGVPIIESPYVEEGTVWGIPKRAVISVIRTPAELGFNEAAGWGNYTVHARLVQRLAWAFPHEEGIVKIIVGDESS